MYLLKNADHKSFFYRYLQNKKKKKKKKKSFSIYFGLHDNTHAAESSTKVRDLLGQG